MPPKTKSSTLKPPPTDLPTHSFPNPLAFTSFLEAHHTTLPGLYLKLAKKSSDIPSITAPQAVEVALCFGWIDGRANGLDEKHWLVRYTPRRPKSLWSAKNVDTVSRFIEEGRMRPAGMEAVDAAKRDGRWERAYDGPARIGVPVDLEETLGKEGNEEAKRVFGELSKTERWEVLHRLQTAAVSRRGERIEGVVGMLKGRAKDGNKAFRVEKAKGKKAKVEKAAAKVSSVDGSEAGSSRPLRSRTRESRLADS